MFVVGQISVHAAGSLSFSYDARWLATVGSFPHSVTVPLVEDDFEDEVIAPWLANLLPEEQQLLSMSRALACFRQKTSRDVHKFTQCFRQQPEFFRPR